MKLTFLGTRGCIEARTPEHARHAALLVEYRRRRVMIDCGEDWLGRFEALRPDAIVLTHAHSDHAFGLRSGAPCPVWATAATWRGLADFPVNGREVIRLRAPATIAGIAFEAVPVEHSLRAPAVGYRISAGRVTVFYAPDIAALDDRQSALAGCRLYIGDGATCDRHLLRIEGGALCGHAPLGEQLEWCRQDGVKRMIATHCGHGLVTGAEEEKLQALRARAARCGIAFDVARDGLEVVLR